MIDFELLLRPISEDSPAGESLRSDPSPTSPYYQIKDARNAARVSERRALQSDDPMATLMATSSSDWEPVAQFAPGLLAEVSKDIEITVWWIEALLRRKGFAGMRAGFELARRMIETFWDVLHPMPDEEGMEVRVAPLTGLNGDDAEGTLIVPIGMVPLLRDDEGPISAWHYKMAREVAAIVDPESKQRRMDSGAVTLERIHGAVAATDPNELFQVLDEVEACLAEWAALSDALDERCGAADAPPSSNVRQALEGVLECVRFLTKDLRRPGSDEGGDGEAGGADASTESGGDSGGTTAQRAAPGVIATREDAIDAMRRAGEFFRRTEPHSPLPYVVDQALRWAQMPLHALVNELITDPSALEQFQLRTGIPAGDEDSSGG